MLKNMLQREPKSSFPQTPPDSGSSPVCWRPRQARDYEQPLLKAVVGIENYYLQPTGLDTLHSRTESWSGSPETTLETGLARWPRHHQVGVHVVVIACESCIAADLVVWA